MKLPLRRITQYAILHLALIGATVSYSYAAKSAQPDTSKTTTNNMTIASSKNRNVAKLNLLAEESDKIINNVKVFYNPISEQVTVTFKLSKDNLVLIKVMDALGNEVLSLHNGNLESGLQNLNFDTQQKLAEGFYFVRVSAGSETIVKRISVR